ncbi:MAG: hypothetical protein ACXAD7_22985 [Candidatus Kariarchaeaceae archaeon]
MRRGISAQGGVFFYYINDTKSTNMILSFLIQLQAIIPWTDVIQAIAAALAIPAAIWGFISLFKKDKEKGKQITSLVAMAEEAKAQTEVMIESNQLQNEFNVKLAELISTGQETAKLQAKKTERDNQQRKIAIKPRIIGDGGGRSGSHGHFKFKNIGRDCTIIELKKGDENYVNILGLEKFKDKSLDTGVSQQISWSQGGNSGGLIIDLKMVLADIDGNKYELTFTGSAKSPRKSEMKEIATP